jgi:hypothetical protein
LKQLDCFYYFHSNEVNLVALIRTYRIHSDPTIFDHLPIEFHLEFTSLQAKRAHYKVNNSYLVDKEVLEELKDIWHRQPPHLKFFEKMRNLLRGYCGMCTAKVQARRATKESLRHNLAVAYNRLHAEPNCPTTQAMLTDTLEVL